MRFLGTGSFRVFLGGAFAWAAFCACAALAANAMAGRPLLSAEPDARGIYLLALMAFLGGVVGILALVRLARKRLVHLTRSVQAIRTATDLNLRVDETGPADQRELSAEINAMLDTLQQMQEQLADSNTELLNLLDARTAEAGVTKQALAEDVARRIRSAQVARKRGRIYRTIHELSPSGIFLLSEEGVILDVNAAVSGILGYSREELLGRTIANLSAPEERDRAKENLKRILNGETLSHEVRNIRKDGETRFVQLRERAIPLDDGHRQIVVMIDDITERRANEERLRKSEERYHALFNTMSSALALHEVITDEQGRVTDFIFTDINPSFLRLLGRERDQVIGRRGFEIFPQMTPEWLARLGRVALTGQEDIVQPVELFGRQFTIFIYSPTHRQFATNLADITERIELREQLLQSQKMEVIGRLTGGVAHDFNNLLQAITGFSQLLLESLDGTSPYRGDVLEIDKAARRATTLTRQLLAFSRRQVFETKVININELITGLDKMFHRLIGADIQLTLHLAENLSPIRADPAQIEQVLANLVVNARDAMATGGEVTIATRNLPRAAGDSLAPDSAPEGFIEVTVRDTGHGIPEAIREQIFEPFFTTKGAARGTGLGLSVVYGIIKQHEGSISVDSTEGVGSTFRFLLPIAPDTAPKEAAPPDEAPPRASELRGNGQRILLVEDEPGVRDFVLSALRQYGYQPFAADTCAAARDMIRQATTPFDLLFTDMILPDETGLALAESLLTQQPNLRILFTSGYMDERSRWSIIQDHGHPFIQKPYSLDHLLQTLHNLFAETRPA